LGIFDLLLTQGDDIGAGAGPEPYLGVAEAPGAGDKLLGRRRGRARKRILLVAEGCCKAVEGCKLLVRDGVVWDAAIGELVVVDLLCNKLVSFCHLAKTQLEMSERHAKPQTALANTEKLWKCSDKPGT
jgi:hypothetical protein